MSTYRIRKNKDNPYVMLNKDFLSNNKLSFKAKGILSYLLSKPDDWKVYEKDLSNNSKDGRDSVRSGLKELEEQGYIRKTQKRNKDGKFNGYDYDVFEYPYFENPRYNNNLPGADFPITDYPLSENPTVLNNELTNNKLEEEEDGKKQKLSTSLKQKYQLIFNRQLSTDFEKEILNLYDNEIIINHCLSIAEKKADKPGWVMKTLSDWKINKLNTIEDINIYLSKRNSNNNNRTNKSKKINNNNINIDIFLNTDDEKYINKFYSKHDKPKIFNDKNKVINIYKIFKSKGYNGDLIIKAMSYINDDNINDNKLDSFIYNARYR